MSKETNQEKKFRSNIKISQKNCENNSKSNDNIFDISIIDQVAEIGQFHQFSLTSEQTILNSHQNFHGSACNNSQVIINTTCVKQHFKIFIKLTFKFNLQSLWVYRKTKNCLCILPINTINHRTILLLNTLTDEQKGKQTLEIYWSILILPQHITTRQKVT